MLSCLYRVMTFLRNSCPQPDPSKHAACRDTAQLRPMGNSSQPTGMPRGTQRQTERAGEGFASVGMASHCAATYSPTRASVRAGNSQQAQAFGEDRLWVARTGGRTERPESNPARVAAHHPSVRPDRHESGPLRIWGRESITALSYDSMPLSSLGLRETSKAR
jgi:hypothetical protein